MRNNNNNNNAQRNRGDVIVYKCIEKGDTIRIITIMAVAYLRKGARNMCTYLFFLTSTQNNININALNATNRGTGNECIYRKQIEWALFLVIFGTYVYEAMAIALHHLYTEWRGPTRRALLHESNLDWDLDRRARNNAVNCICPEFDIRCIHLYILNSTIATYISMVLGQVLVSFFVQSEFS